MDPDQFGLFDHEPVIKVELSLYMWLPKEVEAQINKFKEKAQTEVGKQRFSNSKPHITLFSANMSQESAGKRAFKMLKALESCSSVEFLASQFQLFTSNKRTTLVLKVEPLNGYTEISNSISIAALPSKGVTTADNLHITIFQFQNGSVDQSFIDSFMIDTPSLHFKASRISASFQNLENGQYNNLGGTTLKDS